MIGSSVEESDGVFCWGIGLLSGLELVDDPCFGWSLGPGIVLRG